MNRSGTCSKNNASPTYIHTIQSEVSVMESWTHYAMHALFMEPPSIFNLSGFSITFFICSFFLNLDLFLNHSENLNLDFPQTSLRHFLLASLPLPGFPFPHCACDPRIHIIDIHLFLQWESNGWQAGTPPQVPYFFPTCLPGTPHFPFSLSENPHRPATNRQIGYY